MIEKITLDALDENSVSVSRKKYIEQNGIEYQIGDTHRKSYVNSVFGRKEVKDELPQAQQDAIFVIWGESPTVISGN